MDRVVFNAFIANLLLRHLTLSKGAQALCPRHQADTFCPRAGTAWQRTASPTSGRWIRSVFFVGPLTDNANEIANSGGNPGGDDYGNHGSCSGGFGEPLGAGVG